MPIPIGTQNFELMARAMILNWNTVYSSCLVSSNNNFCSWCTIQEHAIKKSFTFQQHFTKNTPLQCILWSLTVTRILQDFIKITNKTNKNSKNKTKIPKKAQWSYFTIPYCLAWQPFVQCCQDNKNLFNWVCFNVESECHVLTSFGPWCLLCWWYFGTNSSNRWQRGMNCLSRWML